MYAKVFASLWDGTLGTKWQGWTVFVYMLANCDREGYFDVTPEAMAARSGLPLQVVKDGIALLESADPDSRRADEGGARITRIAEHRSWGWQIVNYQHYRGLMDADERRKYMRDYMRKRRLTAVNSGKPPLAYAEAEAEAEAEDSKAQPASQAQTSFTESEPMPAEAQREQIRQIIRLAAQKHAIGPAKPTPERIDPDEVEALVRALPDSLQRQIHKLAGWMGRQNYPKDVSLAIVEDYARRHQTVSNPFAYYARRSDGYHFAQLRLRLGCEQTAHERMKREEREELSR